VVIQVPGQVPAARAVQADPVLPVRVDAGASRARSDKREKLKMKKKLILIIMVSGLLQWALAQTPEEAVSLLENEDGVGARAKGMGNAFNAVADDYTATYWNPAGLTQLEHHEISADLSNLRFENEALFNNTTTLDNRNWTQLHTLGLAYKFPTMRGSFVLGFGFNRFKNYDDFLTFNGYNRTSNGLEFELQNEQGQDQYYPFDQNVQQNETVTQDGSLNAWTVAGGMQLSPNFSLGLAVNFYSGRNQYLFDFIQEDVNNLYNQFPADYNRYELHQKILSDLTGWGVKAGGLLKVNQNINVGFTIEFPTTLNVHETYASNDLLEFDDGYISEYDLGSGEWEYLVTYPYKFSAGAALNLPLFRIAASFDYRDWSQVRFGVPNGYSLDADYSDLLNDNQQFPEKFRPVFSYAAGGEVRVPGSEFKIRGGYHYVPSPLRDAGSDLDRTYYSFGFGYDIDEYTSLDVSYTLGKTKRQSVDAYTPGGTAESISTSQILAGITFKM
jgi:long-subunit fatty acid transport protein